MVYAVIRLKGIVNVKADADKTLKLLKISKKYNCALVEPKKEVIGMLNKVQGMITWGEIDEKTLHFLLLKRGRIVGEKRLTPEYIKEKTNKEISTVVKELQEIKIKLKEIPGVKTFFRLKPPTKGFGEKGLKKPYSLGGNYGYRGKEINELLKRMI